jgi:hypothetical protein
MSACLPHFFRCAINDKLRELVKRVREFSMRLLAEPTPLRLLDVSLNVAFVRVERSKDKRDEIIEHVLRLLTQTGGFDAALVFLSARGLTVCPCFFPVFSAIMKLRKVLEPGMTQIALIGHRFACKAHASALEMLADPTKVAVALWLAQFDMDCEETAILLGKAQSETDLNSSSQREPISDVSCDWTEPNLSYNCTIRNLSSDIDFKVVGAQTQSLVPVGLADFDPIEGLNSTAIVGRVELLPAHEPLPELLEFEPTDGNVASDTSPGGSADDDLLTF